MSEKMSRRDFLKFGSLVFGGVTLAACKREQPGAPVHQTPEVPVAKNTPFFKPVTTIAQPEVSKQTPERSSPEVVFSDSNQVTGGFVTVEKATPPMKWDESVQGYVLEGDYYLVVSKKPYGGGWAIAFGEYGQLLLDSTDGKNPALSAVPLDGDRENLPVFLPEDLPEGSTVLDVAVARVNEGGDALVPVVDSNNVPVVDSATITVQSEQ